MKILLTGATGFLGSHLVHAFLDDGYEIVIVKRSSSDTWRINSMLNRVVSYDVDVVSLESVFSEHHIDIVIHTACSYGRKGESICELIETNELFSMKVLEAAIDFKIATFINTSSMLPKGLNAYSLTKNHFTEWFPQMRDKIQIINMKIEHMYGIKDDETKFIFWILNQLKNNVAEIKLTSGIQTRDFIYVDDIVSAYLTIIKNCSKLKNFAEFGVGTGFSVPVRDFVETVYREYKSLNPACSTVLNFGALAYREGDLMTINVDTSGLLSLGWRPKMTYPDGIRKIVQEGLKK